MWKAALYILCMSPDPLMSAILDDLARGRIDAAEAARRIDALKAAERSVEEKLAAAAEATRKQLKDDQQQPDQQ